MKFHIEKEWLEAACERENSDPVGATTPVGNPNTLAAYAEIVRSARYKELHDEKAKP
jgi:hypothetical protein